MVLLYTNKHYNTEDLTSHGLREGGPVIGHGLGERKKLGGQVFGALKGDAQGSWLEFDAAGKVLEETGGAGGSGGKAYLPGREMAARPVQLFDDASAPAEFPVEAIALGEPLEVSEQGRAGDGGRVADLDRGDRGHELAGAPGPDAEEPFDGETVEVGLIEVPQLGQDFVKAMKPEGLGRHGESSTNRIR